MVLLSREGRDGAGLDGFAEARVRGLRRRLGLERRGGEISREPVLGRSREATTPGNGRSGAAAANGVQTAGVRGPGGSAASPGDRAARSDARGTARRAPQLGQPVLGVAGARSSRSPPLKKPPRRRTTTPPPRPRAPPPARRGAAPP